MIQESAQLMTDILNQIRAIDNRTSRITSGRQFFGMPSVRIPTLVHPELGMLQAVSWLYAMYQELAKPDIRFMIERFDIYNLDGDGTKRRHPPNVDRLRTLFQHNLDPLSKEDMSTQDYCEAWFLEHCNSSYPEDDEQWEMCLQALLKEARQFLRTIQKCVDAIHKDESSTQILRQWDFRHNRYHPPYLFDSIIARVAADLGRDGVDATRVRKRYYDKWAAQLDMLDSYDFDLEARKLIERTLLDDIQPRLPIDGEDIMREFNIPPGRKVGELLKHAMRIYDTAPCSKAELLDRLRREAAG